METTMQKGQKEHTGENSSQGNQDDAHSMLKTVLLMRIQEKRQIK